MVLTLKIGQDVKTWVNDVQSVHIEEDKTYIALVTSPQFWITDERLLVEAELVSE